jgi:hypothetical protein
MTNGNVIIGIPKQKEKPVLGASPMGPKCEFLVTGGFC